MKEKYILTRDDLNDLTNKEQEIFIHFLVPVEDNSVINQFMLLDYEQLLNNLYKKGYLYNTNNLNRYYIILAKNFNYILDYVNKGITKLNSINKNSIDLRIDNIKLGLNALNNLIIKKLNEPKLINSVGRDDLERVIIRINSIENQLNIFSNKNNHENKKLIEIIAEKVNKYSNNIINKEENDNNHITSKPDSYKDYLDRLNQNNFGRKKH